jgi:epoxyqueuosine reductase QueG
MKQHQRSNQFLYLLCDTAYEPDSFCVPAYECQTGYVQPKDEEQFNTCLARFRVITEHTMGLWKGRFPWLRNIRMKITHEPKSLNSILRYIDATAVLHNMLIKFGDDNDKDCRED